MEIIIFRKILYPLLLAYFFIFNSEISKEKKINSYSIFSILVLSMYTSINTIDPIDNFDKIFIFFLIPFLHIVNLVIKFKKNGFTKKNVLTESLCLVGFLICMYISYDYFIVK